MQLQVGTPTFTKTSKPLNKSNAEQHVTFLTTTLPEHQGALQTWSTNSSGKALRQEEETTDSMGCRFSIYSVFMDIHNSFKDIHNSFMDIHNSFKDIHKSFMDIHNSFKDIHK